MYKHERYKKGDFVIIPRKAKLDIKGYGEVLGIKRHSGGWKELKVKVTPGNKVRYFFSDVPGICRVDAKKLMREAWEEADRYFRSR